MDSKDSDEFKIRRREETLARRVGEALDQMNPQVAGECPDAEVVAAYAEQALGAAESARWEGHFAACARCRKVLRVLGASADTPLAENEVAELGELISAVRGPVEITGRSAGRARPRFADWRTRWLAPALGVAGVLIMWLAMRPPWRTPDRGPSETLVAQAPKEEVLLIPAPPEGGRRSRVGPQQDQKTEAAPPPGRSASRAQSLNSPVEGLAKGRADTSKALDRVSPSVGEATSSLQQEKKLGTLPGGREIRAPATPPPPPLPQNAPAAPESDAKAASKTAASGPPQVETDTNAIGTAPSLDKQAAIAQDDAGATTGGAVGQKTSPDARSGARNEQALAVFRPIQKYSSLLKAPSGSTLWRAGKGGTIERSTDSGKTWASQMSPSQEDWLAGAAVSDTICWVAGRNGAIARTVDGVHWVHIPPPAQAAGTDAKPLDWIGISTLDAQSWTITSSDGRKFTTADDGKSWKLQ